MFSSTGTWYTDCPKDPRFSMSGTATGIAGATVAIARAIQEAARRAGLTDEQVEALEIRYGFWKD
jgi:hypothetical protein